MNIYATKLQMMMPLEVIAVKYMYLVRKPNDYHNRERDRERQSEREREFIGYMITDTTVSVLL